MDGDKAKILEDARKLLFGEEEEIEAVSETAEPQTLLINGIVRSVNMQKDRVTVLGRNLNVSWGAPSSLKREKGLVEKPDLTKMLEWSFAIRSMLEDGSWHDFEEISDALNIPLDHVITILKVMARREFLSLSEKWGKVKLRGYRIRPLEEISSP